MLKKSICLIAAVCVMVIVGMPAVSSAKKKVQPEDELYKQIELFADAVAIIQSDYVEDVEAKEIVYGALKGMLSSLDPHSQFLDPDIYREMRVETEGEFGGLGIEITIKDNLLTIIAPIDDTPAYKAGLKAGDRIVKIDGEPTKDITLLEAVKKLRGTPGTEVAVTIMREAEEKLLDFVITRAIIKIKSIKEARILEENIGYVKISDFQEKTPKDLEAALASLKEQKMDSLILDVRNNPGGLLNVAVAVTERFIPRGEMIVSTKGRLKNQCLEFKSRGKNKYLDFPMIVMINKGSASGSEILAGAIQDQGRGMILGTKSFGKGSVQTIIPLKDGSAIRLTTSKYFTPKGKSIHKEGVTPDIVVEEEKGVKEEKVEEKPEDIFEKLEKEKGVVKEEPFVYDAQLARAVDVMKGIKIYEGLSKEK